jgi:fluoroacetyl-CoA thioesterase
MKANFKPGDKKYFERIVRAEDAATFEGSSVHPVYATFALTRDAEWCSRLFVLDMKEEHEEGIGTFVNIKHLSPALVGETVAFEATIDEITGHAVHCSIIARVGNRMVATGATGQKVLLKSKLEELFSKLADAK